jgi:hypothetical protein
VHDNEYVIKPNVIWNTPKEQVANRKDKSIGEAINYAVNEPNFFED